MEGFIFSGKYRPSPILTGRLEINLMLSFKSPRYFTHQKIKKFLAQLFSWDFEAKNDNEAKFKTNNEDSEVVKPKKNRNPPQIHDSDDEDVEELKKTIVK